MYELNFIIGMYIGKNIIHIASDTIHSFMHALGVFEGIPLG